MKENKKFHFGNVATISFAHLVHDVYSSFLAPLLPLLIDKLSISYSLAGMLSVFQRLPSFLNPVIGILADKMAVRYLLIVSPAITAVSMSLLGVAPSYTVVVILLLVMGLSSAMFHVPAPVMIKHVSGARIGKGMSIFMLGGELARTLGPLFVLSAVSLWGLEGTYKLIPIGLAASFILFWKFRKIRISNEFKERNKNKEVSFKKTFKNFIPLFITLSGIYFFSSILKAAFTAFLPTFITSEGNSLWAGGIALAALQLTGAIGTLVSGTISDKFGRKSTLLIMAIASPLLTFLFLFSSDAFAIPILLLLGFFLISSTPVILALVNELKSDHPSFLNSIMMTINFVTSAVTVPLVGLLGDIYGLETTYIICAIIALLSIPFILRLEK